MTHVRLAARAIAGLAPGDHVCCSYGSDDEQQAIVGRHARDAVDRGAQFFYFADRSDEATVRAYLEEAGIDAAAGLASGQIQILRWFVPDGELDVEAMITSFEELKASTLRAGYSALVGASEMSWSIDSRFDPERVLQYERGVNRAFAAADVIGLCLYDRRLFASTLLEPLEAVHGHRIRTHEHATTATRRRLTVTERDDLVFSLAGDLDLDCVEYLGARLAARPSDGDVVVQTAELEFVDVTGCRLLVEAAQRLEAGCRMILPRPNSHLLRLLSLCDWREHPRLVLA